MESLLQKRGVRLTLLVVVFLAAVYGAYRLSNIFAPLLFSFLVAYMLDPVADALERRKLTRMGAVVTIFLVGALLLTAFASVAGYYAYGGITRFVESARGDKFFTIEQVEADPSIQAENELLQIPGEEALYVDRNGNGEYDKSYFRTATDYVEGLSEHLGADTYGLVTSLRGWLAEKELELEDPATQARIREQVDAVVREKLDWLAGAPVRAFLGSDPSEGRSGPVAGSELEEADQRSLLSSVFTWFSWMLLCPLYIFYLLLEIDPLVERIRGYLPGKHRDTIVRVLGKIDRTMASFFRGRLTICVLKGLGTSIGLMALGVPFALPIGMAAGFLALIPYIGIWFAIIPSLILAWFESQSFGYILGVGGVFAAMELLEGFWMVPSFLGKEVGLHPLTVIVTMLVFAELLGFVGVLLSVPLAAIAKILLQEFVMPLVEEFAAEEPSRPPETSG